MKSAGDIEKEYYILVCITKLLEEHSDELIYNFSDNEIKKIYYTYTTIVSSKLDKTFEEKIEVLKYFHKTDDYDIAKSMFDQFFFSFTDIKRVNADFKLDFEKKYDKIRNINK